MRFNGMLLLGVLCLLHSTEAGAAQVRDTRWFLRQMVDLDRLPAFEAEGVTCRQFSSYDRASVAPDKPGWDANGDAGQYLRVEPNGEAVMAEMAGPGVIWRIWSANPQGKIRFYLDGARAPTFERSFADLFSGEVRPFLFPICWRRGPGSNAANCYLPIPYARSCKVTADRRYGQYYHIQYTTYPAGTPVRTFRLPLAPAEDAELRRVADRFRAAGADPRGTVAGVETIRQDAALAPGQTAVLADLKGQGRILSLRVRAESPERYALRSLILRGAFDGISPPAVEAPLGDFFGTSFKATPYRSLPLGLAADGWFYCYFPMPFGKSARLAVTNEGQRPAALSWEVVWLRQAFDAAGTGYLHAKWRREDPVTVLDYPILHVTGRGRYIGCLMAVEHPQPGWFGEGDEKVTVDGEAFPSTFGTGTEDFLGDAWGLRLFQHPYHGCNLREGALTVSYRWQITESIPFRTSLRMEIENWRREGDDYATTAYWYSAGGEDFFGQPLTAEACRPRGRALHRALRAVDLFPDAGVISDADLPEPFYYGEAVDLGAKKAGEGIAFRASVPARDVYALAAYTGKGMAGLAPFEAAVDGRRLGASAAEFGSAGGGVLGRARLDAGEHAVELRFTGEGRAVFDAFQLSPSRRDPDVTEAEALNSTEVQGPQPIPEWARLDWSGGGQLLFPATEAGDAFAVDVPARARALPVLGPRSRGAGGGDLRAVTPEGKPRGRRLSTYAEKPGVVTRTLGWLQATAGANRIRFVVAGKADQASGYRVGIDWIRIQPAVVAGAIEGEELRVVETFGGDVSIQDLSAPSGPWSAGAQLWFRPSQPGSAVILELPVEKDGRCEIAGYFTKSWDYGVAQCFLDGRPLGGKIDLYAPQVTHSGKIVLGTVDLSADTHSLRFEMVERNEKSKGYFFGLDCLALQARE